MDSRPLAPERPRLLVRVQGGGHNRSVVGCAISPGLHRTRYSGACVARILRRVRVHVGSGSIRLRRRPAAGSNVGDRIPSPLLRPHHADRRLLLRASWREAPRSSANAGSRGMIGRGGRTLAQAKINLSLRVLDKEPDGYHSIETVFLRLDLGDDVRLHIRANARTLRCGVMRDEPQEDNLAYRAAALYSDEAGWPGGFEIVIKKRIPIGGGLGGGSADAAAVLRILNAISPHPLGAEALRNLAARIGSDVPFLASDFVMAIGWGRGEKLLKLRPLPSRDVQLFLPPF